MNVTRHNYEEYFLRYVDNELQTEERRWVEQFARENADLAEELSALKSAVLDPEEILSFTDKASLYREETMAGGSAHVKPLWKKAIPAVAAAILLLGAGAFWLREENLPRKTSGGLAPAGVAQAAGSQGAASQSAPAQAADSQSAGSLAVGSQTAPAQAAGSQSATAQAAPLQAVGSQAATTQAAGSQSATAAAGGSQSAPAQTAGSQVATTQATAAHPATAKATGSQSAIAQTGGPAASLAKPTTGPDRYTPPANPGQANTQTATATPNTTLPGNSPSPANSILPVPAITAQSNKSVPATAPGTTTVASAENKPAAVTIAHAASYHTLEDGDQKDDGNKILFVRADQVINGGVKGFFRRAGRALKRSAALNSDNIHPETESDK